MTQRPEYDGKLLRDVGERGRGRLHCAAAGHLEASTAEAGGGIQISIPTPGFDRCRGPPVKGGWTAIVCYKSWMIDN